jgi:serine/threonine protein kinase
MLCADAERTERRSAPPTNTPRICCHMMTPADQMEGAILASGWVLGPRLVKGPNDSGGNFGSAYLAERGEERAFVKALDFRRAMSGPDWLDQVHELTSHVRWERELLEFCGQHGMSRVVRLLGYEDYIAPDHSNDPMQRVHCLIFEVGKGDLRKHFDIATAPGKAWRLRVLRDVGLALDQLHRKGIAHLDVKPSNVILVGHLTQQHEAMKLGDLGRSVRKGSPGPFDGLNWPGDPNYRPPEKWYGLQSAQWQDEREAGDAYLLGSLAVYLFTGAPMGALLMKEVPEQFRPGIYPGRFDRQLIDVLEHAQALVMTLHVKNELPACVRDELYRLIQELTHPDPCRRGDRRARAQGIVGIDRYHQRFLRMSERVAFEERREAKA